MNAAIMIEENELTKGWLNDKIQILSQSETLRKTLEKRILSQNNKASSELIANILTEGI